MSPCRPCLPERVSNRHLINRAVLARYICKAASHATGAKRNDVRPSLNHKPSSTLSSSRHELPVFFLASPIHGDHRRGAPARPARQQYRRRPGVRRRRRAEETAVVVVRGGRQERGLRDRRPRQRTGFQGAGGGVAAGVRVQEEHVPAAVVAGDQVQGRPRAGSRRGREAEIGRGRRAVREGEHGRGAVPAEGGPEDVRRVRRAQGRAGQALRLLLLAGRVRRRTVRGRVRGQGRRPHARRRRAMGHVHRFLQEAEDHERLRSKMIALRAYIYDQGLDMTENEPADRRGSSEIHVLYP